MENLLVMSLSGSTMMGIYFLLKYLLKDKISSRLYYLIIKEAVLFFLIPLCFLKDWYRKIILFAIPKRQMKSVHIPVTWTNCAVHTGGKTYYNSFAIIQTVVVAAWLLIVCTVMVRMLLKYYRMRRLILKYENTEMTEKQRSFLEEIKRQYGVRRSVMLCQGQAGDHTMTFGVFRPVIICNKETGSWEAGIHVRHEMVHIKRFDVLWKMLARLAVILHCWNPIAWLMLREFERACEYSCDEIVMQGRSREEVKEYLRLLIAEACVASETGITSMGWHNSFADDMENMKERIRNLTKTKKWNRYVTGMLAAGLAFANSMTVFAYRDTLHQEISENASPKEITASLMTTDFSFMPDGVDGEMLKDLNQWQEMEFLYEEQFIDSEGNIYPYSDADTVTTYRSRSHDFESGTINDHTKYTDGSCKVVVCPAQRCSICGNVIRSKEKSIITHTVCPH